ncbi:probable tRNA (uracil-O(2)-)-methyltransferase [Patiria miniata]|uniref:tRNA (uracil-O(2)-)-methyltransferase n=1 Tax=Patiria miniata TaxID=46514 RepID=A0A913ZTT4_PATMI|nr:probable tRNA (uracil-O(2)-)-methyltransferase [Patiria miniata]
MTFQFPNLIISMEVINWQNVKSIETSCVEKTFSKAIEIWLLKPHVVNRRLSGAVVLYRTRTNDGLTLGKLIQKFSTTSCELSDSFSAQYIETLTKDNAGLSCDENGLKNSIPKYSENEQEHEERNSSCDGPESSPHLTDENSRFELCVRKLVPRSTGHRNGSAEETVNEIIVIDHEECSATFIPLQNASEASSDSRNLMQTAYRFTFSLKTSRINLTISEDYKEPKSPSLAVACPTIAWLQDCLLPKIAKWASEVSPDAPVRNSQALVSMERYSALYGELKKKYGAKFVEIWPENTDPLKFVYEDVAIATYLISLWEQERAEMGLESPQSFVDLGCGNGLLVHILNSEGYPGKGIDLRRRKIWDLYGPETNLEECSITPSDSFLFPDYDWLIGNHSDELTPWIPVMAARSSYTTRYFVLPCCFHDFDMKFMRTDQTKTQYRAYLDFVEEVGRVCGFQVQEDILRIPSTKRICQIGSHRTYTPEWSEAIHQEITDYIASRHSCNSENNTENAVNAASTLTCQIPNTHSSCGDQTHVLESNTKSSVPSAQWAPHFHPREKMEPVRNCAKVDYDLRQMIVNKVACSILTDAGVDFADSVRGKKEKKLWRKGGSLTFAEIAKLFDSDTLKQLKSECGGLKTLLKNSHQVFQVSSCSVEIRDWSEGAPTQRAHAKKPMRKNARKTDTFKTRLCWFHAQHPDGCPLLASQCQFAHGKDELRKLMLSVK